MHTVVITRRQVNIHEHAVLISLRQFGIAEQLGGRKRMTFCLKNTAVLDFSALADFAIGRQQYRAWVGIGNARARFQGTGEKSVEAGIAVRIGIGGFAEVDVEIRQNGVNEAVLDPRRSGIRQAVGKA